MDAGGRPEPRIGAGAGNAEARIGPPRSGLLEVDSLDYGQALQEAAQAIEGQFDSAQSDPFASAENARPADLDPVGGGDADPDGAAEVDAIGTVIQFDQHG